MFESWLSSCGPLESCSSSEPDRALGSSLPPVCCMTRWSAMPFSAALSLLKSPVRRFLLCILLLACPALCGSGSCMLPRGSRRSLPPFRWRLILIRQAGFPFEYPIVWKADASASVSRRTFCGAGVAAGRGHLLAGRELLRQDDADCAGLRVPQDSGAFAEACTARALGSIPAKPDTLLINGVSFQHFDTGDAGMCHGADQHVYWTYRESGSGGACYLFEGDMGTSCSGAYEGSAT